MDRILPNSQAVKKVVLFIVFMCLVLGAGDIMAQCPMCRASAESNLKSGGNSAAGLNAGILYMLGMPYLFLTIFGIYMYRRFKKKQNPSNDSNFLDLTKTEHLN